LPVRDFRKGKGSKFSEIFPQNTIFARRPKKGKKRVKDFQKCCRTHQKFAIKPKMKISGQIFPKIFL